MAKKKKKNKKVKKKLRLRVLFLIIFLIYVLWQIGYFIINLHVDNIIVTGNVYLSDNYIIDESSIEEDTKFLFLFSGSVEKTLENNEFIKDANVSKSFFKDVSIEIIENKILFYYTYKDKVVLEGENEVEYDSSFIGIPTLINYTPSDILSDFVEKMSLLDQNLINKISEIEYAPSIKDDVVLDDERFILKMNDGNTVHVNIINFEKFANYDSILELVSEKGTLYLDSSNDGNIFDIYE